MLCFIEHTGYIYLSLHWNFIWIYFTVLLTIDIYLYDFYLTHLLDVLMDGFGYFIILLTIGYMIYI